MEITLDSMIKTLTAIAKAHPEYLELPIVYAVDEEGNQFNKAYFSACAGVFEDNQFTANSEDDTQNVNAICIN